MTERHARSRLQGSAQRDRAYGAGRLTVTVNPTAICHYRTASGTHTAIYSSGVTALFVQESYAAVSELIRQLDKAVARRIL